MGYFDGRSMHIYLDGVIILIEEVCTYILMVIYIDGLSILMEGVGTDILMG